MMRGKTVVITGASPGIGLETAREDFVRCKARDDASARTWAPPEKLCVTWS